MPASATMLLLHVLFAVEISGPHHTAATYTSNECKYTETYGIDMSFGLGGGEGAFTFTRSAQVINTTRAC